MGSLAPPLPPAGPAQRFALGCMRLSTDDDRDEERGARVIAAALDAGVTCFDTARAYALDDADLGHNERLLARALREHGARRVNIVTKGGMRRPDGRWETDGRARTLREDCEASLAALGGYAIDTYLLHAPDPRVPWATSVRALAELERAGLVRRVGLSNVTRRQLDEAVAVARIAVVEIALGPFSDVALRGGVVARCIELGIEVLAHSPLGLRSMTRGSPRSRRPPSCAGHALVASARPRSWRSRPPSGAIDRGSRSRWSLAGRLAQRTTSSPRRPARSASRFAVAPTRRGRPAAGAGPPCRGSSSNSRTGTASTWRAARSSEPSRFTPAWPGHSASPTEAPSSGGAGHI